MKNHYIIKYNDSFINSTINLTNNYTIGWETIKVNSLESLSINGLKFILQMKMIPRYNKLFISPPNMTSSIHIDSLSQSYAINYVWGEGESKMRWFEVMTDEPNKPAVTTAGDDYMIYNDTQVKLIEEIEVPHNTLMLVRTDIPHQVSNYSDTKRYCLSVRGSPVMKWEDAVEHFRPYFLEESQRIEL
jgi:hypothetical protein